MEWLRQDKLLGENDLNVFHFELGQCKVFELLRRRNVLYHQNPGQSIRLIP